MNKLNKNKAFCKIISHRIFINLGDSLFYIVLMWILYDLTKSSFYTAIGGFMFSLSDVLNFFVGPIIDRSNKEKLLAFTSGTAFLVIAGLCFFSLGDMLNVWILVFSIPLFNLMSRITYSIHNVVVPAIVRKDELVTANSILSMTNTGIDLLFNAISGVFLVVLSIQEILLINSTINLLALLVALLILRSAMLDRKQPVEMEKRPKVKADERKADLKEYWSSYLKDLKTGLMFIRNRTILSLIIPLVGLHLLYAIMLVNLPAFSSEVFGSAIGYGLVLTFFSVGSISGSMISSFLVKHFAVGKLISILFLYGGTSWILMTLFVKQISVVGVIFMIAAMNALGVTNIIFGTVFQQLPPENMIGRVNTVNLSLMAVAALLGSLLGGIITQISDSIVPFFLCGLGYLLISFVMGINRLVRRLPFMHEINEKILG